MASSSFAGVLASLAAPQPALVEVSDWIDDGLLDDVAVISQEKGQMREEDTDLRSVPAPDAFPHPPAMRKPPQPERNPNWSTSPARPSACKLSITEVDGPDKSRKAKELKRASITIRLSTPECARLKARAAESGLTISEYLRSCTLEVESLRAQVKDALARMRAPIPPEKSPIPMEKPSLLERVAHIFPRPRPEQPIGAA